MERKIHAESLEWKDDPDRKPMILLGCRQVGKTFIVMEFGDREYENIAYLNSQTIRMTDCSSRGIWMPTGWPTG